MSELRDEVLKQLDKLVEEITRDISGVDAFRYYSEKVLSIPGIAVVDKEVK